MNRKTKIILNSLIMLLSLGICLVCGLTGNYDKYNIWVALLAGLTGIGVVNIGIGVASKSNYPIVIGGLLLVIPLTILLIVVKAFADFPWGYPLVALILTIVVLFVRAMAGVDSAYVADNQKPGYKSYADRKKEQKAKDKELNK